MEYIIVTPAKNEARFIEETIASVAAQTVKPKKWVIVDDGSDDGTVAAVSKHLKQHAFMQLVQRQRTTEVRAGGSKVVRAFNAGFDVVRGETYDIIVKLDADLTLPPSYFEEVIRCFQAGPRIGLCGGYCVVQQDGKLIPEHYSEDHVRGAFKAYRRECFEAIGGLQEVWSWDGLDEAAVAYRGWGLKVLPLPVIHHRPTSQEYNLLKHSFKTGREMYKERVELLSLLVVSAAYFFRKPAVVGSALFLVGYGVSWLKREPKVIDKDLGDYIRRDRYQKLAGKLRLGRKRDMSTQ